MAQIYVETTGNDSTGTGSTGAPFKTIAKAITASNVDDEIIVGDGTFTDEGATSNGLTPKSGTTIRAKNSPKLNGPTGGGMWTGAHTTIIQQDAGKTKHAFTIAGVNGVTIKGFEIRRCMYGVNIGGTPTFDIHILDCKIHNCVGNGISSDKANRLEFDGNEVYDCSQSTSGRSNISVLAPQDFGTGTLDGTHHIRLTNNCSHHCMIDGGNTSDANGIIMDKGLYHASAMIGLRALISGNYTYKNRGPGIKVMASSGVDVHDNTAYDNGKIIITADSTKPGTWGGALSSQNARANSWRRNIGWATGAQPKRSGHPEDPAGKAGGFANNGQDTGYPKTWPLDGNTIEDNLFYGTDKDGAGPMLAGTAVNVQPGAQSPDSTKNLLGVNPQFRDPEPAGVDPLDPEGAPPDLRLETSSPAYNAVGGNQHIGAWKGATVEPDADLAVVNDAVLEILGDPIEGTTNVYPVGASARFTPATWNLTPDTVTRTVQWWNGSTYVDQAVSIAGPSGGYYTFTVPSVEKKGGLRVKTVATKAGDPTVTRFSNWIDVAPAPAVTETAPANTTLPVISPTAPKVAVACSVSTGSWTGTTPVAFTYQWKLDTTPISGATASTYSPVSGDKTHVLRCDVTATNSVGSATVTTAPTSAVTDQVDLTLTELTARLIAAEAAIATNKANVAAALTTNNAQDVAIEALSTGYGKRIGALETDTGGLRARTTAVEQAVVDESFAAADSDEIINSRIDINTIRIASVEAALGIDGGGGISYAGGTDAAVRPRLVSASVGPAVLPGPVAHGDALEFSYPTGYTQADFTGTSASAEGQVVINGNDVYLEVNGKVAFTYGADTIAVANLSNLTWPTGSEVIAVAAGKVSSTANTTALEVVDLLEEALDDEELAQQLGDVVDTAVRGAKGVATQSDILAGTDTGKVITAEAAGGWNKIRTIAYAATMTIDFSGDAPVWAAENKVVDVSAALALQAATFPARAEGKEFSVRFVRASGTGNVTLQDMSGGASVEYRTGLTSADLPPLGTTVGDSLTVRGKVMSTGVWRVEAFEWKTA